MNPLLKHLAVRFWLTALMGCAVCLVVLPWWQYFFGLNWLALPSAVILSICFIVIGWALNRLGGYLMSRHVNEASVWERAGMVKEAESALQQGVAYFDSFWLSPIQRRQQTDWMMAILARFYLGQTARNLHARTMLADYLCRYPHDDTVAEGWLEQLLNRQHCSEREYEGAARIGEALGDHDRIQQLLMQFHLANGRSDFDAMQNYQKVWQNQRPLPKELLVGLTRLLLNEGVMTHWALKVYLTSHQSGNTDALEGIAAAVKWLSPTVENRQDLEAARQAVSDMPSVRMDRLVSRFQPAEPEVPIRDRAKRRAKRSAVKARALSRELAASGKVWAMAGAARTGGLVKKLQTYGYARATIVGSGVAIMAIVLFAVGWKIRGGDAPSSPPPMETVKPIIEPFTIQVAAYVNVVDARNVVERLKQHGLDAFWTEANSAERTWYQVKVSHFETKALARQYGQELKTKGLIDDFYVANYSKPQHQNP